MPTYQYACTECGEQLEVVQRFTDDPLTECLSCSGRLRKVFSPVGVVFKGSGFYRTDSRKTGAGTSKGSDKTAQTSASGSGASESSGSSTSTSTSTSSSSGGSGSTGSSTSSSSSSSAA